VRGHCLYVDAATSLSGVDGLVCDAGNRELDARATCVN